MPPAQRTLWNARLFPGACTDREESLRLALPLAGPDAAPQGWRERGWRPGGCRWPRARLLADGDRLLGRFVAIEDHVAARRFVAALMRETPAAEAAALLGALPAVRARRAGLCDAQLAGTDPVVRLRVYRGLAEATGDVGWEDRAFGLLADQIERATLGAGPLPRTLPAHPRSDADPEPAAASQTSRTRSSPNVAISRVAAAARIDLGGGWTDTPPYSIERGGAVLNAAIALHGAASDHGRSLPPGRAPADPAEH